MQNGIPKEIDTIVIGHDATAIRFAWNKANFVGRLIAVKLPRPDTPLGKLASEYVRMAFTNKLTVQFLGAAEQGIALVGVKVWAPTHKWTLNAGLVWNGMARPWQMEMLHDRPLKEEILKAEADAAKNKRGAWSGRLPFVDW